MARLAERSADPATRLWYLEWAEMFERLAAFNPPAGPDNDNDGGADDPAAGERR